MCLQELQEVVLQGGLVDLVLAQIRREAGVVRVGESVYGIVNQLSGGVVVQTVPPGLVFQTPGDPGHVFFCVLVVVSPKPLGPDGAFEIGGEIPVRLNAAKQKGPPVYRGNMGEIGACKISAHLTVTFSAHGVSPLSFALCHPL